MPLPLPEPSELTALLTLLESGALLLLPSALAARNLRDAFDARQRTLGHAAWESPSALAWSQWTTSLWSDLILSGAESRLLLNSAQEHALWREIVAETPTSDTESPATDLNPSGWSPSLTSPDSLADLARSAFHLAAAYNATTRLHSFTAASTPDARIFAGWAEAFTRRCATRGYLSPALLDHALLQHLAAHTLTPPGTLHLVAFPDLSPAQTSLLDAFRAQDVTIPHHDLTAPTQTLHASVIAANPREELLFAARFTRTFLETNPTATRVALIVPNLADVRPELESVLRETLAPELQSIAADLSSTPWEFTSGPPLTSIALLATALDLARFATAPLPLERVSALVLTPYLGVHATGPTAAEAIAVFDAQILRRTRSLRPEVDLTTLLSLLESPQANPVLSTLLPWPKTLHAFLQRTGDLNLPRSFADWTEFLRDLLLAANWPGPRPPNATESAAALAWDSALDLIATLDFTGRRVPFATALDALIRQLQASVLTPPPTHAPVQILTPAEAAGSLFDAVLFLRATDANLPPPERPNPLLPWALQRSLSMPGADPALTSARAQALIASLLRRSHTVLFTSAAEDADGHLRPSPLFAELNLPNLDPATLLSAPPPALLLEPETYYDTTPLPPLPSPRIKGGAGVLQAQAACGFRAFAQFRLSASDLQSNDLGLNAADSGERVHIALQLFWQHVRSQDNLRNLPLPERDTILSQCIDQALARRLRPHGPWDIAYLDSQKQRLLNLLRAWLDFELTRGPFEVIDAEHKHLLPIGPLELDIRIDRIDRVALTPAGLSADGDPAVFLVDYKTGASASPTLWDGDRPDEPQLPLYALIPTPEHLHGLAFARLRLGKDMNWRGLQSLDGILPGTKSTQDLLPLLDSWRFTLTRLADDFASGAALVDPKNYPVTCVHCAQRLLCRLDPAALRSTLEDPEPSQSQEDRNG